MKKIAALLEVSERIVEFQRSCIMDVFNLRSYAPA